MKSVGIICEYNPFHSGHARQIEILRGMGYDCIVCVMSGNFTERGEPAMFDKYTRAQCATIGGADLVLELPFPYSSLSAEGFARAGVYILSSLGIKNISFGSECADTQLLCAAADAICSDEFVKTYSESQKVGSKGSTKAFFESLSSVMGKDVALLSNDILAISYIAAIKRLGCDMNVIPIKREGLAFTETTLDENQLPSASAIRAALSSKADVNSLLKNNAPEKVAECLIEAIKNGYAPVTAQNVGRELLSFFKLMTPSEIASRAISRSLGGSSVAQDGCGICERLCNSARSAKDLDSFMDGAYNAKYTDARINRVALFSLIGASDLFDSSLPQYTTLLAASTQGRALLSKIRKSCTFKIVTKPADSPEGVQSRIGGAADELYALAMKGGENTDYFVKCKPYMSCK